MVQPKVRGGGGGGGELMENLIDLRFTVAWELSLETTLIVVCQNGWSQTGNLSLLASWHISVVCCKCQLLFFSF